MNDQSTKEIGELVEGYATKEPIDLDLRAEQYRIDAIRRTRTQYWLERTPKLYRLPNNEPDHGFDIDHPTIQQNRPQLEAILRWRYGPKGIIATGFTNMGKTRAMYALCHRLLCEEMRDCGIWTAHDFFSSLQEQVRYGKDEARDFVKRQAERPVLFIDDYGQEAIIANKQEWAAGWFFSLLDQRMSNELPLLMTTNLTADQIADGGKNIAANPLIRRLLDVAEPLKFMGPPPKKKT